MKQDNFFQNAVYSSLLLLSIYVLIKSLVREDGVIDYIIPNYLNSDTLYPLEMAKDVYQRGLSPHSWRLMGYNFLFPDLFLFIVLGFFTLSYHSLYVAYILFIILTLLLVFYLLIRKSALHKLLQIALTFSFASTVINIFSNLTVEPNKSFIYSFFVPAIHSGNIFNGLILSVLSYGFYQKPESKYFFYGLFGFTTLALFSNVLLIPSFILPILILMILKSLYVKNQALNFHNLISLVKEKSILRKYLQMLLGSFVMSKLLRLILNKVFSFTISRSSSGTHFNKVPGEFVILMTDFFSYMFNNPFITVLVFFFFAQLFFYTKKLLRKEQVAINHQLYLFLISLCSISVVIIAGNWSIGKIRYIHAFFLSLLALLILKIVGLLLQKAKMPAIIAGVYFIVNIFFLLHTPLRDKSDLVSIQNKQQIIQCMDELYSSKVIQIGAANYYIRGLIHTFGQFSYPIIQVHDSGVRLNDWLNNKEWGFSGAQSDGTINFFISDQKDDKDLEKHVGKPSKTYQCLGLYVHTYQDDSLDRYLRSLKLSK
jgi:hypothetical protein